jgi:hypothetical protein
MAQEGAHVSLQIIYAREWLVRAVDVVTVIGKNSGNVTTALKRVTEAPGGDALVILSKNDVEACGTTFEGPTTDSKWLTVSTAMIFLSSTPGYIEGRFAAIKAILRVVEDDRLRHQRPVELEKAQKSGGVLRRLILIGSSELVKNISERSRRAWVELRNRFIPSQRLAEEDEADAGQFSQESIATLPDEDGDLFGAGARDPYAFAARDASLGQG